MLKPNFDKALYNLAYFYFLQNDFKKSREYLNKCENIEPNDQLNQELKAKGY